MKKYQDFILESFDTKPAKWTLERDDESETRYFFFIGEKEYRVKIDRYSFHLGYYHVEFQGEDSDGDLTTHATYGGNQYKVLITVIDCIRDLVRRKENTEYPVYKLGFSAFDFEDGKKSARPSVYARLIKKFMPKDYEVTTKEIPAYGMIPKSISFRIIKK